MLFWDYLSKFYGIQKNMLKKNWSLPYKLIYFILFYIGMVAGGLFSVLIYKYLGMRINMK